jgi:4'-phosphopantetheinyl transferase
MFVPSLTGSALAKAHGLHLCCIETPETPLREGARRIVRGALRETLASLLPAAGESLALISVPGQPIRLAPPWADIGLSVSHEPGLSLLAINLDGPVGVDLLRVAAMPADIDAVARDYLGPDTARALAMLPAGQRRRAFARAWTRFEARLKCRALDLREWTPRIAEWLAACCVTDLVMPAGWMGAVAVPGDRLRSASRSA